MRIALISLEQRWLNKDENFKLCADFVYKAAGCGCSLVAFPEMTLTSYSLDITTVAEPVDDSPTLHRFGQLAHDAGVNVIFGACLVDRTSGHPRNSLCLARCDGEVVSVYDKMHPFSFAGEDKVLEMGDKPAVIDVAGLTLGCSVCYDLRFPEIYSVLASRCDAIINIANWPASRVAHWRSLLAARAIENQLFVFGVNRIGTDGNGLYYEKSSMAVTPSGSILVAVLSEPEMDIYEVDSEQTAIYRREFPTIRDKRYSLYEKLLRGIKIE